MDYKIDTDIPIPPEPMFERLRTSRLPIATMKVGGGASA